MPKYQRETRNLEFQLDDDAILDIVKELAEKRSEKKRIQAEQKEVLKNYQAKIGALDGQMDRMLEDIDKGSVHKDVICEWRPNMPEGTKTLYRLDTNEPIHTIPIPTEELQQNAFPDSDSEEEEFDGEEEEGAEESEEAETEE